MPETVTYQADGLTMRGDLYVGAGGGKRPGVLVFPEAFGLSENARERARKLSELGFTALACDLHGEAKLVTDLDEALGLLAPIRQNPGRIRARSQGGMDALLAHDVDPARVMAIGYCFGGTMALELARGGAAIAAVCGFHSGLATTQPEDAKNIRAKILVMIGADDPAIPPEQRAAFEAEMRAAKVDWQMHIYGGVRHSFTNKHADRVGRPELARYDADADARSWASMLALFAEIS